MNENLHPLNAILTGEKIHSLALERDMPVKTIADELGISNQAVRSWLKGDAMPSLDHIILLAQILNVELSDIIQIQN